MSSRFKTYGFAILLTALAWAVDILLKERLPQSSGGVYVAAALISTWVGGLGPGLLAMALTAAINLIFFDRPYLSLAVGVHGFDRLVFFTALALVVSLLRRNQAVLNEVNSEALEEKVKGAHRGSPRIQQTVGSVLLHAWRTTCGAPSRCHPGLRRYARHRPRRGIG